ncbi:cobalt-zinc-cadmium resistance protein [Candidatus Magnetomorum sp. HK-1]|nr:cobalt-zinc-cadmium resistance protein [Candidatus Magnetomorum sp. HK-1]
MRRVIEAFAGNTVFANILLLLIFLAGGLSLNSMIREIFPEFSLDMISISVPYPGADPEEVEEGISQKIEEALETVDGIKQYTTKSSENVSQTQIEVKENYDVNEVLDQVRSKVDAISTFPVDAEKPIISEIILKESIAVISLAANMSERRLKEWAENLKDEIKQYPTISQLAVFGAREYEISIEVSESLLREYGLKFEDVSKAIRQSNLNLSGGTIRTQGEEIRIRTVGRKYTGETMANIVVLARPGGDIVTLDRLANIKDDFGEDMIQASVNGKRSVFLIVQKTKEEDAILISQTIREYVKKKQTELPDDIHLQILYESTDMLRARINLLVKNGILGLILVFAILWAFLDARLSFWGGMGIPISIAGALSILWVIGGTINMISLFGLIMVLGIVVDDAIVVGEAIFVHRQNGEPPLKAAVEGVCEVGLPVFSAVVTTIVAFMPLAFIGGIMGKFIQILPMVVIACLLISLVECLILLPAHLSELPDPETKTNTNNSISRIYHKIHNIPGKLLDDFIQRVYTPFISIALKWRYVSLSTAIALLMIIIGFMEGGLIKFEVFPPLDGFIVQATVEFPNGTPADVTHKAVKEIEKSVLNLENKVKTISGEPLIRDVLSITGQTLGDMVQIGPNFGVVQTIFLESEKRGVHSKDLMVMWQESVPKIPGIKSLTFEGMKAGPPGAPIEIWIQGRDLDKILSAADDLMNRLGKFEGVYQIRSDFSPGKNEMRLELKPEARTLGITVNDLARQVYAGFYGDEAVRIQRGRDDIRVKVRYTAEERSHISNLKRVRIRTKDGHEIPLLSIANVTFSPGYSTITRTDGMRRVSVSADVDTNKANSNEIIQELSKVYFKELTHKYHGIHIALQGEKKKMRESFGSLAIGFPLAIIGMFIIIATIFRSYVQPFVIMFTIPFGIIGGILAHLALGFDLSMMSIFGMVALAGVVVNDAIVLIERINENLAKGMPFFKALESAGKRRFRAIFLTTVSTVGGLAPLIFETDLQAKFLIPMALSIAGGVLFATVLTLVLIPSLLVILNDCRRAYYRIKFGMWPARELVEPARNRNS